MATIINTIRQQYADAGQWQQQFPWFSLGHLVQAEAEKNTQAFSAASQKAAVYFNDVQRLHWLLTQQDIDVASILSEYNLDKEIEPSYSPKVAAKFIDEVPESTLVIDPFIPDHQPLQTTITDNAECLAETVAELNIPAPPVAIYEIALDRSKDFTMVTTQENYKQQPEDILITDEAAITDGTAEQIKLVNEANVELVSTATVEPVLPITSTDVSTEAMVQNAAIITENITDHPTQETEITDATDATESIETPIETIAPEETAEIIAIKEQEEIMEPADATIINTKEETVVAHSYQPANILTITNPDGDIENVEDTENEWVSNSGEQPTFIPDQVDTVVEEIFERHETEPVSNFSAPENDNASDESLMITAPTESYDTEAIAVELAEPIEMPKTWEDNDYDPDDTDGPEETQSREPELLSVADIKEDTFKSPALSQSLAEVSKHFKEDPATQELVIASEPYHTVDYFASQGIRLELEPKADDKFGQQLKSFTSWLKQMKRLPAIKLGDQEPDKTVENIAASSLQDGEVVTESMAEVLLKQGKEEQAVEVWQKLSLLHPEKSHYFAALIEKTKV